METGTGLRGVDSWNYPKPSQGEMSIFLITAAVPIPTDIVKEGYSHRFRKWRLLGLGQETWHKHRLRGAMCALGMCAWACWPLAVAQPSPWSGALPTGGKIWALKVYPIGAPVIGGKPVPRTSVAHLH